MTRKQQAVTALTDRYNNTLHLQLSSISLGLYLRRNVPTVVANLQTGKKLCKSGGRYVPDRWDITLQRYVPLDS